MQFKPLAISSLRNFPAVWKRKCLKECLAQTAKYLNTWREAQFWRRNVERYTFQFNQNHFGTLHNFMRALHSTTFMPCFTSQLGEIWSLSLLQYWCWLAKDENTWKVFEAKNKWDNTTRSYVSVAERNLNPTLTQQHCQKQTPEFCDLWISVTLCVICKTDSQIILQNKMYFWGLSAWKPGWTIPSAHEGRNSHRWAWEVLSKVPLAG